MRSSKRKAQTHKVVREEAPEAACNGNIQRLEENPYSLLLSGGDERLKSAEGVWK